MAENFTEIIELITSERFPIREKTRVLILMIDDLTPDEEFCAWLAELNVPVILAVKTRASADLIYAAHLCVAAFDATVGDFPAAEALRRGLINKVSASNKSLETEALALAERIAALAPLAIRADLRAVTQGFELPLGDALRLEMNLFTQLFATNDMREGTRAFLEKRKPRFTGE